MSTTLEALEAEVLKLAPVLVRVRSCFCLFACGVAIQDLALNSLKEGLDSGAGALADDVFASLEAKYLKMAQERGETR